MDSEVYDGERMPISLSYRVPVLKSVHEVKVWEDVDWWFTKSLASHGTPPPYRWSGGRSEWEIHGENRDAMVCRLYFLSIYGPR